MSELRRLRDVLGAWKPGADAMTGPQTPALIAAWPDVVGEQVARRTRPLQVRDHTLLVLTVSSEWSHHLTFLAPAILERLKTTIIGADIRRLRFVVATGRTRALLLRGSKPTKRDATNVADRATLGPITSPPMGPRDARSATEVQSGGAADDLENMLARLRHEQTALDAQRRQAGWQACAACGRFWLPKAGDTMCDLCTADRVREREAGIARVLMHDPWLSFDDVAEHHGAIEQDEYDRVRRKLLTLWELHMHNAQARLRRGALEAGDRVAAWSFAMMYARAPKERLGRAALETAVGRDWAEALVKGSRRQVKEPS